MYVGVDGGNTKTVALVATPDGKIVGSARAGPGDIYGAASPAEAVANLLSAVRTALGSAGAAVDAVGAAAFSLAGADWPEDFELLRSELGAGLGGGVAPVVVNDAIGALRAGTPDGVGVSVVYGTGHAVGARSRTGAVWHSSFWGEPTGAVELGRAAVTALLRSGLSMGPPTSLERRALEEFRHPTVESLLHAFTRRGGLPWREYGRLAPAVLDEAAAGDEVARAIVLRQVELLAGYAAHAAATVALVPPFPLVIGGGVLRHPSLLVLETLSSGVPGAELVRPEFEPAVGGLLLAFDSAGLVPSAARLRATMPPTDLFATA